MNKTNNLSNNYHDVAEKTYHRSFMFMLILIVIVVISNAIARIFFNETLVLIPSEIVRLIEHTLWIFAVPVSIKIIGVESIPKITELIMTVKNSKSKH